MFTRSVPIYDALYSFKDYEAAARDLHALVSGRRPDAADVLDVACGTGLHLSFFQEWYESTGLDINPDMVQQARHRCPNLTIHQGDMVDFDLHREFDVVTCLFSSVAYVQTPDRLQRAVASMARHVRSGGLLLVEPWIDRDRYVTGRITANFVDNQELKIAWMYTSDLGANVSIFDIHYLVGTPERVEHFTERHELGLFTPEQYEQCFRVAGLAVEFDPNGPFGRGLYVGSKPS